MSEGDRLTPEEIIKSFKGIFKTNVKDDRIEAHKAGLKKTQFTHIWMRVDKSIFKDAVKHLMTIEEYPHLAVVSGYDMGETIDLVYHFSIYFSERGKELSLNMTVELPKSEPEIETITDLIPGALITEQEKQEMLGIKVKGIPKDKRAFVSDDFPKGMYPWRKDETGPGKMVRNLHEVKS
jgi:membrane-bound hydrogenase subunit beta